MTVPNVGLSPLGGGLVSLHFSPAASEVLYARPHGGKWTSSDIRVSTTTRHWDPRGTYGRAVKALLQLQLCLVIALAYFILAKVNSRKYGHTIALPKYQHARNRHPYIPFRCWRGFA